MSDVRLQSFSGNMSSIDEHGTSPEEQVCRVPDARALGGRGAGADAVLGSGGASSTPSVVQSPDDAGSCIDELLTAAGACGSVALSGGAAALVAGLVCAGSTMSAIECLVQQKNIAK